MIKGLTPHQILGSPPVKKRKIWSLLEGIKKKMGGHQFYQQIRCSGYLEESMFIRALHGHSGSWYIDVFWNKDWERLHTISIPNWVFRRTFIRRFRIEQAKQGKLVIGSEPRPIVQALQPPIMTDFLWKVRKQHKNSLEFHQTANSRVLCCGDPPEDHQPQRRIRKVRKTTW